MRLALPFLVLAAVAAAGGVPPPPAAQESSQDVLDELLPRVAASEERLLELYHTGSFVVRSTIQDLGARGKVKSTDEVETRMFVKDGRPWEEITRYVENGKDVTASRNAKRQKALLSGKRKRADGIPFTSPFTPDQQPRYTFTDVGVDPGNPALRRIRFRARKKAEDAYHGEAVVDVERGAVVEMELRPSDLPRFVKRMEVEMEMKHETEVGPALSSLRVSAAGSVLFIRKRIEVEATFSDYVPNESAALESR